MSPTTLLDPYLVHRAGGPPITLGRCPFCGRHVRQSSASKSGSRCRYEGAKFNLDGVVVSSGVRSAETGRMPMRPPKEKVIMPSEREELIKALRDIANLCETPPRNRPLAIDVVCGRLARQALFNVGEVTQ